MSAAYHLGTGSQDVSKRFSMLGLGSMMWFEKNFSRHESYLNNGIIGVANNIIDEPMLSEIKKNLSAEISTINSGKWLKFVEAKQFEDAKKIKQQCKLTTSFDVGW